MIGLLVDAIAGLAPNSADHDADIHDRDNDTEDHVVTTARVVDVLGVVDDVSPVDDREPSLLIPRPPLSTS